MGEQEELKSIKFINVGGIDYKIQDEDLTNLVNQLIEVMQSNNESLSRHINHLNDRISAIENDHVKKPVVLYEYDSTQEPIYGSTKTNVSQATDSWNLTDLDMTQFKYVKAYIKNSDHNLSNNELSPALVITIPLTTGVESLHHPTMYMGSASAMFANDQNLILHTLCAVDETKTKFQIINSRSIYGTVGTNKSKEGRYLLRLEGWYD